MILLSYLDLTYLAILVMLLSGLLFLNGFQQTRQLWIASIRMVIQLSIMAVWLQWVFDSGSLLWVSLVGMIMMLFAAYEIAKRQTYQFSGKGSFLTGLLSLSLTALILTIFALTLIVQPQPWYSAQYAIPLLGMVLGNSMTAIGLALDSLTKNAMQQQAKIEAQLALGYSAKQSIHFIKQQSMHTALIPVINMLAAAGIVSLPGMMTGQILAGIEPVEAIKYQIMIMFLISASTGFGLLVALWLGQKRLFDHRQRLSLDCLKKA